MAIKNLIFDFGEVLVDWNPKYLYRKIFESEEEIDQFFTTIDFFNMNYKMDGGLTFAEFVSTLTEKYPQYREAIAAYCSRWDETLGSANTPVVEILEQFKNDDRYRIFGLTNWAAETFPIGQKKFPFFGWFEDVVVSGKIGIVKPNAEIYQCLLERNQLIAQECLFIDDRLENVEGAKKLGIEAIHYRSPEQLTNDLSQLNLL